MIRRKIGIALALASFDAVFAQQIPKTQVTLQVTDVTGAAVPKARVEVGSKLPDRTQSAETDQNGKAVLELPVGSYELLVKSPGFCPNKGPLEVLNQRDQTIEAKLKIDSCPGPCAGSCVTVYPEPVAPALGHLTIKVVDSMGASIPGAEIAIDPGDTVQTLFRTDTLGFANLDLPFGTHVLSVEMLGFDKWTNKIEVQDGGDHVMEATLRVAENIDVWPVVDVVLIEPESVILTSSIPLNTLRTLAPLPIRKKSCCKPASSSLRNRKDGLPKASE